MFSQINTIILALAASSLVAAHGKIAQATGDGGGNTTALGIQGAIIPGFGPNGKTEKDTTVFWSKNIATDNDIGFTQGGGGNNKLTDLTKTMALSGDTLAQVTSGGSVSGVFHVVTDDGCGPLEGLIDPTGTAKWSTAAKATVESDIPGKKGDCPSSLANDSGKQHKIRRWLAKMGVITRRADNVNKDYNFSIKIPAGMTCNGTIGDQTDLCLVKMSNNNKNGPFGGVMVVQMAGTATNRRVVRSFTV